MKILCIESMWDREDSMSVLPILELIHQNYGAEFVHRKFYSFEELRNITDGIVENDFDILYYAGHGKTGRLKNGTSDTDYIRLEDFLENFKFPFKGKTVHISACAVLDISDRRLYGLIK